ncbi:hypothetical protein ACKWWR_005778 [Pseudomonas aeruginosa]|uniref:hypothetical protein n=1 Tax=Pseudomonas aeruginosa TaxID=287 RepID=UPI00053D2C3C|nr:hypothetical protein [Pseudomonas aeruginosa]SCY62557.1 Uncharacterised protein [Acinetobacter baumannii]AWS88553.1 hypothetical protein AM489_05970 [Pseudomonas aeruginosa]AWT32019.1 hypothetical protein DCS61_24045 [Pseudomonas aeruginosa]AXZ91668.1 hypothetical protein AM490_14020 [Pseudomonas aeruginosa]AYK26217.1 hypothetical protein PA34_030445 [Pseudomonas aeruginosa]
MKQGYYITREDLDGFKLSPDVRIYAGRGWLPLVLSAKPVVSDAIVVAVREDAGALRIELNRCSPPQREWLAEVEAASRMVCEICGEPGQLRFEGLKNGRPAGWHRTRCDEHIDTHTSKGLKGML